MQVYEMPPTAMSHYPSHDVVVIGQSINEWYSGWKGFSNYGCTIQLVDMSDRPDGPTKWSQMIRVVIQDFTAGFSANWVTDIVVIELDGYEHIWVQHNSKVIKWVTNISAAQNGFLSDMSVFIEDPEYFLI